LIQNASVHKNVRSISHISSDNVVTSTAPKPDFPKGNAVSYLFENISQWSKKSALTCYKTSKEITYGQLESDMARWGSFLEREKVPLGGVVAVISPNTLYTPAVIFGTSRAGRVLTGVNPAYTPGEIANQLSDSNACMVVCPPSWVENVKKAINITSKHIRIITVGGKYEYLPAVEDILEDSRLGFSDPALLTGNETMVLLYSSGTTGKPKGAQVSHNALICNTQVMSLPQLLAASPTTAENQARYMLLLPLFHIAGYLAIGMVGLRNGINLTPVEKFDPSSFVETIIKQEITNMQMVPSMLNFALQHPSFSPEKAPMLKSILVGAAPVLQTAADAIYRRFGEDFVLQHGYGMTECCLSVMDPVDGPVRCGYTGMPLPGVEIRVVDVETGANLPQYKDGEIHIKSDSLMTGYLNNEAATKATFSQDGWLMSGDVGHFDELGRVRIVDRTKDLIKCNALQISPSEIEDVLLGLGGVREVAVVGVPHEKFGEAPRAFIVQDGSIDESKVHAWMTEHSAKHKHLTGGVVFIDAIPKNATGKILRKDLRLLR